MFNVRISCPFPDTLDAVRQIGPYPPHDVLAERPGVVRCHLCAGGREIGEFERRGKNGSYRFQVSGLRSHVSGFRIRSSRSPSIFSFLSFQPFVQARQRVCLFLVHER